MLRKVNDRVVLAKGNISDFSLDYLLYVCKFLNINTNLSKNSTSKRVKEHLLGRYLAYLCLKKLKSRNQTITTENRLPIWPKGFLGSISHTSDRVSVLVLSRRNEKFVGVDVENLDRQLTPKLVDIVFSEKEKAVLCHLNKEAIIAGFSVKEAFYKAIYPEFKVYHDYKDVELYRRKGNTYIVRSKLVDVEIIVKSYLFNGNTYSYAIK